ncbi:pyrroloquinoline quinone biosynthesis peptide chaperone PqqD [Polymorphum gilvum]|uniref:Coenzyme PQQ synthesis D n=1 Tax=Polymorphum gilvum (strain LMG 25793 / CGMCC 1.9160 / SL003B-26A1) TaxID=991905 RepID=F2J235_POLGS|nr:pyrroloquinoline quinone biosynthesis peptide chaperone PqqD [Polymorphum gilvum]ADZ68794.1 Coenzyme PQQ synthesis D [Polymorphum gilvum SL003B-26A1]
MAAPRRRIEVTRDSRPALPRHVRLHFDPLRARWVVLAPEKVLWPDAISADILGRCDGRRTVAEIVDALAQDYAAPKEQIEPDVVAFLQQWSDRLLVRCAEDRP